MIGSEEMLKESKVNELCKIDYEYKLKQKAKRASEDALRMMEKWSRFKEIVLKEAKEVCRSRKIDGMKKFGWWLKERSVSWCGGGHEVARILKCIRV